MKSSLTPPYHNLSRLLILCSLGILVLISCNNEEKSITEKGPKSYIVHPEWSKNANIYEVNIRQYTPEGTFSAFEQHLPRLKQMDVNILWLMPIYPIGLKNRKGRLGSYYAVKDYKAINPEFGTMDEFKNLVHKAHDMGFKIILDWVANHTAWDNPLITEHPDWYTKDSLNKIIYPADWTDVADLNYDNKDLRNYMVDAMKFWLQETDVDGFRCDVAAMVPTDFWDSTRVELDKIKPVFMLAEAEQPDLQIHAFDMTYAWELYHMMNRIAIDSMRADTIVSYFTKQDTLYPANAYRMNFITNHDENAWNGTTFERLGKGVKPFTILIYTLPGMPLTYSGQETGLNKRLSFFDKDTIQWNPNSPWLKFYSALNKLKTDNPALWNGEYGGSLNFIPSTLGKSVLAFMRESGDNKLVVITNLSANSQTFKLEGNDYAGEYTDVFSGKKNSLTRDMSFQFNPWEYRILRK